MLHLIDARGLDVREIIGSAIVLFGFGWGNAWLVERGTFNRPL